MEPKENMLEYAEGNTPLAEFENSKEHIKEELVEGLFNPDIENLQEFEFYDSEWYEEIAQDEIILPHIENTLNIKESICGRDDRKQIGTTSYPFRCICRLIITAKNGQRYIGSGFFVSPRCIITSGHVVHITSGASGKDWAREIKVIPGANGASAPFGSQVSTNFRSVTGWTQNRNSDYDHGAIILPNDLLFNRIRSYFGYKQLNTSAILNNSGYPGDKPGTQWYNAGRVTGITTHKLHYMLDTKGGQSGSPVYLHQGTSRFAVGVHGYGGCPNKCIRVQGYIFQRWAEWRRL